MSIFSALFGPSKKEVERRVDERNKLEAREREERRDRRAARRAEWDGSDRRGYVSPGTAAPARVFEPGQVPSLLVEAPAGRGGKAEPAWPREPAQAPPQL